MKIELDIPSDRIANMMTSAIESGDPVTTALRGGWCWGIYFGGWKTSPPDGTWYAEAKTYEAKNLRLEVIEVQDEDKYHRGGASDDEHIQLNLDKGCFKVHQIGRNHLKAGLERMAVKYPHQFGQIMRDDTDAPCADLFLQCILFGEGEIRVTPNQYRAALRRLGLSQVGAAALFGANERTSRYWASGARGIPTCVGIVLKLLAAEKITIADVEAVRYDVQTDEETMTIQDPAGKLSIINVEVTTQPGSRPIRMAAIIETATRDPVLFYEITNDGQIIGWSIDEVYDHRELSAGAEIALAFVR